MNDLLDSAVAAHGGLDRWNETGSISFDAAIGGAFWHIKGKGDALQEVRWKADPTRQRVTIASPGHNKGGVYEPHRVAIHRRNGTVIDARKQPEKSFDGQHFD